MTDISGIEAAAKAIFDTWAAIKGSDMSWTEAIAAADRPNVYPEMAAIVPLCRAEARSAIQAYLPFHPPASREEGLRDAAKAITDLAEEWKRHDGTLPRIDGEWPAYMAKVVLRLIPTKPEAKEGELSCIFCAKPVAEGDAHMDDGGDVAHKDCAIQEFLAQAREERKRTAPFIKMCAEIVHPEKAVGAHYTAENRAQSAFAIIDNIKRQAAAIQSKKPE